MKEMWDSRYSSEDYAYGIAPNEFFKAALDKYDLSGSILMPAEGEGRNAVYAAKKGLAVTAFDISIEGKNKALKLAEKEGVTIRYEVGDFFKMELEDHYDAAGLIFAHFPLPLLSSYHKKIADLIKIGGLIILEGFSKKHIALQQVNPQVGGPKQVEMLFSKDSIREDFADFEVLLLEEVEVELNEGEYHQGLSSVIRFIGKKKK
jgi:cyclopropane fatty-acyl-phospholipid synthase-like methyltransferase